ncbi:hypothetical protein BDP27DRAFT_810278 [Rhodocollybia butyracea]|uniref:Uncharacterized protein n=1 Tax=Rhodocollybia butyracea TaxID=206335 RepID=A0A9P5Q9D1_9AGAR|nr:hypothetical protein BDP27DRAFT_810278 [Rhodocollybia butyracea]
MQNNIQTPVNPDRRALPQGWTECYNSQKDTWYYVQTDVIPARISYYHPATETYAEGNHSIPSSTSTSSSHQQFCSDSKDEQKTGSPSTYAGPSAAGGSTASSSTIPIPVNPELKNAALPLTSAPNTADLTSPPEYSAYSKVSNEQLQVDISQSAQSPELEGDTSTLPPGYTNFPVVAKPPSPPNVESPQSALTEINRPPSVVSASINSRPASIGVSPPSRTSVTPPVAVYHSDSASRPFVNVLPSPPATASIPSPEAMTPAQKLYASAFTVRPSISSNQGSGRISVSAPTVHLSSDSHLPPTISLPTNTYSNPISQSANSFYKTGIFQNLNRPGRGSSYHADSLNQSPTISLISSRPTQPVSSPQSQKIEYQHTTNSAPTASRPRPTTVPSVTLVAHPPNTDVSNSTSQISPPPTPTMQGQIGVSGISYNVPTAASTPMTATSTSSVSPVTHLHPSLAQINSAVSPSPSLASVPQSPSAPHRPPYHNSTSLPILPSHNAHQPRLSSSSNTNTVLLNMGKVAGRYAGRAALRYAGRLAVGSILGTNPTLLSPFSNSNLFDANSLNALNSSLANLDVTSTGIDMSQFQAAFQGIPGTDYQGIIASIGQQGQSNPLPGVNYHAIIKALMKIQHAASQGQSQAHPHTLSSSGPTNVNPNPNVTNSDYQAIVNAQAQQIQQMQAMMGTLNLQQQSNIQSGYNPGVPGQLHTQVHPHVQHTSPLSPTHPIMNTLNSQNNVQSGQNFDVAGQSHAQVRPQTQIFNTTSTTMNLQQQQNNVQSGYNPSFAGQSHAQVSTHSTSMQSPQPIQAQLPVTHPQHYQQAVPTHQPPPVYSTSLPPAQPAPSPQISHAHGSFTSVLNTVQHGLMNAMHSQSPGSTSHSGPSGSGSGGSSSLLSTIEHQVLHSAEHSAEHEASSLWHQYEHSQSQTQSSSDTGSTGQSSSDPSQFNPYSGNDGSQNQINGSSPDFNQFGQNGDDNFNDGSNGMYSSTSLTNNQGETFVYDSTAFIDPSSGDFIQNTDSTFIDGDFVDSIDSTNVFDCSGDLLFSSTTDDAGFY